MKTFNVNGKQYQAVELDMNFLTFLDKHGVEINILEGLAASACFLAYCSGMSEKQANQEITEHVIANDGLLPTELFEAYTQAIEDSGFFRALAKRGEKAEQTESPESEQTSEETQKKKRTTKSATE